MAQKFLNGIDISGNIVVDSNSAVGATVLDIQGTQGQLFSITNSLSGDLFSVSDISGIPILNVNSSGLVTIDGTLAVDGKLGVGLTPTTVNLEVKSIQDSSFDEGIGIVRSNTSQTGYINMVGGAMNINAPNAVPIKFRDGGNTNLTIGGDGNATFAGELEATSLDINGSADISGNLTGVDTLTASNFVGAGSYHEFGNGTGSVSNDGSWHARVNIAGTQHARLDVKDLSDGIITSMFAHTGHGAGKVGTYSNHPLHLMINGTSKATLDSSSNFAVTGEIEGGSLDINGNADISGTITTATWGGGIIPEAKLQNQSGTNTGDQNLSTYLKGSNSSGTYEGTVTDWNSPTVTGFYSASNASNRWGGQSNWSSIMHVKLYDDNNNYASQIGFNTYDSGLHTRTNNGGTWTGWAEIYTSDTFTNNSGNWNTAYGWGDHELSAQDKTDIGNLSGTNTGDQTLASLGAQASGNYITGTGSLSAQDLTDIGNLSGTNTGDQTLPTTLPATTSDTLDFFQDSSGVSLHQFNNSLDDVGGNYAATSTGASYGTGLDTRFGSHGINTQGDGVYVDIAGLPTIQAVSLWYKAIGNDNGYIVDFRHDTPGNSRSYLYTLAGSDQYINMGNDTTTTNQTGDIWINGVAFTSGQYNFTSGNWYHIVITTDAVSTKQNWNQGIRIGNRSDGTSNGNAGYFDQVRTFNRRLTSSDVALLYAEVETGATADQTAGEILSLIKTVDGASSGLDADLLDGNEASAFALSSIVNQTDFVSAANGGTFSGNIDLNASFKWAKNQSNSYTYSAADSTGMYIERFSTAGAGSQLADMRFQARDNNTGTYNSISIKGSDNTVVITSPNTIISGNLTVGGTRTILNTATVEVEDNILQLNTTQASPDTATAATSGISIYRGDGVTQASLIFDDADDTWDLTNNLLVAGNLQSSGDFTSVGYVQATSFLYLRNNMRLLNKAANGWLSFAIRNTTASEAVYDLANIGTLTAAGEIEGGSLDINGNADISGNLSGVDTYTGQNIALTIGASGSGRRDPFTALHASNNTITISQFGQSHAASPAANQIGVSNAEQHLHLITDSQANMQAGTSTKGIFLRSGGDVGIGIKSPSAKLDVAGEVQATSLDINGDADISGTLTVGTISATNYGLASADIPNNAANTTGDAGSVDGRHYQDHYGVGYKYDISVGGDADTYYPVTIDGVWAYASTVSIHRGYSETAPSTWNTSTHKGGLTFQYQIIGANGWGGYPLSIKVLQAAEVYSQILGGLAFTAHGMKHVVWLRGGTATYHVYSHSALSIEVNDSTSASNYVASSSPNAWYTYDNSNNAYDTTVAQRTSTQVIAAYESEIFNYMDVSYGSAKTNEILGGGSASKTFWNSGNDGAASGLDADLLDAQQGSHYLARANHTGTQLYATISNPPTIPSGNAIIDWTASGAGTIHTDNYIENVVQTTVSGSSGSTTGNAATVTTNANLTGHVTSVGNAASLGSFTVAQLSTALSDATISGNNTGDQDLSTYGLKTFDSTADLTSPSASTGTWTNATATDWGKPKIGTSLARYNDGTGTLSFAVPTGMKTAYISQLTWSSGGYMDVYGVQADGDEVFLRRVNTKQTVENDNEGDPNLHDGTAISFAGHIGDFPTILLHNKVGRLHLTGLGFSKSELAASDGTGIVNYSQLTGTVPTWNQNTTGSSGSTTGNAATATNVAYTGLTGTVPTWNQNTTGSAGSVAWGNITSRPYIETNATTSATATTAIASVAHATYTAAFFDFVIKNGTNVRAGTVYACHDGTNVEFTETSTVDLGDTSDVTLNVVISTSYLQLQATTTSSTWTIKSLIRAI